MPKKFSYDAKFEPYVQHLRKKGNAERTIRQCISTLRLFEQSGGRTAFDFQQWYRLNFPESSDKTLSQHRQTINRYLNWLDKPNEDNEQLLIDNLADSENNISDDNTKENIIKDNNISENNISEDIISKDIISKDIISKDIISKDIISENNTSAVTKKQSFNCRRDNFLRLQMLSAFKGVTMSDLINEAIEKFLLQHVDEIQQAKKML